MIKTKNSILSYDTGSGSKSDPIIFDCTFLTWTFSLMYDSYKDLPLINASKMFKKIVIAKQNVKIYLKTVEDLILEHQKRMKLITLSNLKTKFVNKASWFLNYYVVPYKIKPSKLTFFNFDYMWSNIWSSASFFFSSFSKLRYAWLYLKNTRSNYFGTFYYTGTAHKFKAPENLNELDKKHNPSHTKIIPKKKKNLPYKVHPYVSYASSPYCYVAATCSSGSLGFKKKTRRSKDVFKNMKDYFSVFFVYYFSFYKIDFLFFRLNGLYRIFKFFKKQIFKQFKDNFYNLKKVYKKSLALKKTISMYEHNRDAYPNLLKNLIALMGGHDMSKPVPVDSETKAYLSKSMSDSDSKFNIKKSRLRRMVIKILYYVSKFPKFIYILDTTTYPFNGCRRVRHYKK